jgi:glucan 1,3-beta-glucosidase
MDLSGQQWILKGISIDGAHTGIRVGGFDVVCLHCSFQHAAVGIDASGVSGSLTVIDSTGNSVGTLISSSQSGGGAGNSIILDNVQNSGNTVTLNGNVALSGSVASTWVHGNLVSDPVA